MKLSRLSAMAFAAALAGAVACSGQGGGGGCGTSEADLEKEAQNATTQLRTTCGPGTRLVGNVCERIQGTSTGTATTR